MGTSTGRLRNVYGMGTSTGRLRNPVSGRPGDQMMGRSGDVPETSVLFFKFVFLNFKCISLTLTGYSRFYSEL